MIPSVVGFDAYGFDKISYTKTLDRHLGQIIREAARHWLREILQQGVPVETGMAKAALLPLGRFLNNVGGLQINPKRKPYYSKLEGTVQDIGAGVDRGNDFYIRDDKSHPMTFIYQFQWSTEILHYWTREFYNGPAVVGPDAMAAAEDAANEYIASAIASRVPKLAPHIIKRGFRG